MGEQQASEQKIQNLQILPILQTVGLLPNALIGSGRALNVSEFIICADHLLEFSSVHGLYAFSLQTYSTALPI